MANEHPKVKCILLFSGKRKSGKDYVTDILHERLGSNKSVVIKIAAPIKKHWAEKCNVQFEELLSSGPTKEEHRFAMVKWAEELRNKKPGFVCDSAIAMSNADEKPIWIVSDVRRKTDINHFKLKYGSNLVKTIRISADDIIRTKRGWIYTDGIDDKSTECDLDDYMEWDWHIMNNGDNQKDIDEFISLLIRTADQMLHI